MKKNLKTLLSELDTVNLHIERIQNDPEYIERRTREVFKNRTPHDYTAEIGAILDSI